MREPRTDCIQSWASWKGRAESEGPEKEMEKTTHGSQMRKMFSVRELATANAPERPGRQWGS